MTAVVLINPKTPYNVGSAIRACAIYDVPTLRWTGKRITTAEGVRMSGGTFSKRKARLPREERLKDYVGVDWREATSETVVTDIAVRDRLTPVAVEIVDGAELLHDFVHPENPLYVFGPEDGSVPKGVLAVCHRFVRIPTCNRTPLNLAAALNVVLYDRHAKQLRFEAEVELERRAEAFA